MSETPVFSYSRLGTFDKCQEQYGLRYSARQRSEREGIEAFVGKVVHAVIELDQRSPGTVSDLDLIGAVAARFDNEYDDARHYDVRDYGLSHWRAHALSCFQSYLAVGRVEPGWHLAGAELRLAMPLMTSPMASFMGILDRLVARNGHGPPEFRVQDFKTGKQPARRWFLEDHQLPLYSALVVHKFELPSDTVMRGERIYLTRGNIEEILIDQERREEALEWARDRARRALAFERRYQETREAETTVGPLCGWCVYKHTLCRAFNGEGAAPAP